MTRQGDDAKRDSTIGSIYTTTPRLVSPPACVSLGQAVAKGLNETQCVSWRVVSACGSVCGRSCCEPRCCDWIYPRLCASKGVKKIKRKNRDRKKMRESHKYKCLVNCFVKGPRVDEKEEEGIKNNEKTRRKEEEERKNPRKRKEKKKQKQDKERKAKVKEGKVVDISGTTRLKGE